MVALDEFSALCDEVEKELLQEEMGGEKIEAGELEINLGVAYCYLDIF